MAKKIVNAPRMGKAAVKYARAQVGKRQAASGMCYKFSRLCYGVPAVGDVDGDADADAVDGWKAAKKHGKVVASRDAKSFPEGSMALWSGGANGHGHAAPVVGGGLCVSTDARGPRTVAIAKIDDLTVRWGLTLLGYIVVDGNGRRLCTPPAPKAKPSRPRVRAALKAVRLAKAHAQAANTKAQLRAAEIALVKARDGKK